MACIFKMKLKYLLTFAFMITFTGCSTSQESPPVVYSDATLPFVLPEGIFYQDKIYWKSDVDTQEEINGQELGVIKESVSREEFPTSNLNVTKGAKKYIGDKVIKNDNSLFVKHDNKILHFIYTDKMELGEEMNVFDSNNSEDASYPPHFIYNGMRYLPAAVTEPDIFEAIPDSFQYVGKMKEEIAVYASRNYTGVHIKKNTKMYIGKNQNRFMLLQHPNGFIELYECIAYRDLNNQRIY